METLLPLDKMTTKDKLAIMEQRWENLFCNPESVPSPSWHKDILLSRVWCETLIRVIFIGTKKIMYYKDDEMFIGWLDDFPDYKTQGTTIEELKEHLKDIYEELTSGSIPNHFHFPHPMCP